ncbi:MAG: helix-turn-helix domain-containing protein, partial [Pseudomonadota bacterium]
GVLVKVPYNDRPVRYEYRLTRKGLGLYPVLMSLARWGDEWMDKGQGAPLEYVHQTCGKLTKPTLTCSECGEPLRPEEVKPRIGPALRAVAEDLDAKGEPHPDIPPMLRETV